MIEAYQFRKYIGLSRVFVGISGEYQYRRTGEFDAPTVALFGRVLRDGYRFTLGAAIRKPLTDKLEIFGVVSRIKRSAASTVFSTKANSLRANVDDFPSGKETIYAASAVGQRQVVSTGLPSLASADIAQAIIRDVA